MAGQATIGGGIILVWSVWVLIWRQRREWWGSRAKFEGL